MIKPLEILAEMLGFREPDLSPIVRTPFRGTAIIPIEKLRYSPVYQDHVFAPGVRALELVIHLKNQYGENWKQHLGEIHGETEDVKEELRYYDREGLNLANPVVSMTPDNVPVVFHGFHTVCAYRNQGYTKIKVTLQQPHDKSSEELNLKPFSDIKVYLSRNSSTLVG